MVSDKFILKASKDFTIRNNVIIGDTPKYLETRGIAQILWESLSESPDFVSQINVNTGEKTTFDEIKERSIRCALWLKEQGVSKDDVIAISTSNKNDDLIPYIATLFVGAIVNPWYHDITEVNARRFFQTYRPKIIFACEYSIDRLAHIANSEGIPCSFVVYGKHPKYSSLKGLMSEQSQELVASFEYTIPNQPSEQCSTIFLSSGSTAITRDPMISYKSLAYCSNYIPVESEKSYLSYATLSCVTGVFLNLASIVNKNTRIIHDKFHPDKMGEIIERHKINTVVLAANILRRCSNENLFRRFDYSSLENLYCFGSKLSRDVFEDVQGALPGCFVSNVYGMMGLGGLTVRQTRDRKNMDTVGFVTSGVSLKVMDTTTNCALGANQIGEIWIKTPNAFLGYYGYPQATIETLDKDGWVHTGDLGYYDEDGEVMVTDRMKQMILTKNCNLSPTIIEDILLRHPEVKDCTVVPIPHEVDVERPFAFVVKCPKAKVTEKELVDLAISHHQSYRITGGITFVDELVYTPTGKKNLRLLIEQAKEYLSRR